MAKTILSLVLLVLINCTFSSANNWCSMKCDSHAPHTLCRHRPNDYSPACGTIVKHGLTPDEKQRILNLHNALRQKVANGQERRGNPGPQPPARNMQTLVWDDELAMIAQVWAQQCNFDHACSTVARFPVGQNVGYQSHAQVEDIVNSWYNEVAKLNRNGVTNRQIRWNSMGVLHYTQLVWAESNKIGCGAVTYSKDNDGYEILHLVCNYGPRGNWGEKVYEIA